MVSFAAHRPGLAGIIGLLVALALIVFPAIPSPEPPLARPVTQPCAFLYIAVETSCGNLLLPPSP